MHQTNTAKCKCQHVSSLSAVVRIENQKQSLGVEDFSAELQTQYHESYMKHGLRRNCEIYVMILTNIIWYDDFCYAIITMQETSIYEQVLIKNK